jgi:putative FmdB family regulatory protein
MPIYEYRCEACGHVLEALQKMSDAPLTDCPACSKPHLKKQISAAGFRLKGGGWYETDFKSGSKKNIAGEAGSSASSDSKPAVSTANAPAAVKPATKPAE